MRPSVFERGAKERGDVSNLSKEATDANKEKRLAKKGRGGKGPDSIRFT
jgi:hypothetical protein